MERGTCLVFRGALIGFAVTVGLMLIPIVHFSSGPIAPFVGGFVGGSKSGVTDSQALALGGLIALYMVAPLAAGATRWFGFIFRRSSGNHLLTYPESVLT
ncbi:MAG: hypothetical protein FJ318_03880 [SAR202 cluster bacterium]|nr:hypothetical protein [SAR202 cluster bacterium]